VAIVTDCIENASKHNRYEESAGMISRRRRTGRWSFLMMGANQDLDSVSAGMGIARDQLVPYEANETGTIGGWKRLGATMVQSYSTRLRDHGQLGTIYPWKNSPDDQEPSGAN
jgi:hypothetical protein